MKKIVILTSNQEEFNAVNQQVARLDNNISVEVVISGVGLINCAAMTMQCINQFKPDLLLFCGIAGGVDSTVKLQDVVIATQVAQVEHLTLHQSFEDTPFYEYLVHPKKKEMQPTWFQAVKSKNFNVEHYDYPVHFGRIVSTDQFPAPEVGYSLLLDNNVKAIDMETSALFQIGWMYDIPTIAVRAISNCLDAEGKDPDIAQADISLAPHRAAEVCIDLLNSIQR